MGLAAVWMLMSMAAPPAADGNIVLTSGPVTKELTLPELVGPRDHYVFRVIGISVAPGSPALFRVFVDLPTAGRSTPSNSPHYVGQVSILAGPSRSPRNVIMPLYWPQQRKLSAGAKLRFTLVPLGDNTASPIRIEKIEIAVNHT